MGTGTSYQGDQAFNNNNNETPLNLRYPWVNETLLNFRYPWGMPNLRPQGVGLDSSQPFNGIFGQNLITS